MTLPMLTARLPLFVLVLVTSVTLLRVGDLVAPDWNLNLGSQSSGPPDVELDPAVVRLRSVRGPDPIPLDPDVLRLISRAQFPERCDATRRTLFTPVFSSLCGAGTYLTYLLSIGLQTDRTLVLRKQSPRRPFRAPRPGCNATWGSYFRPITACTDHALGVKDREHDIDYDARPRDVLLVDSERVLDGRRLYRAGWPSDIQRRFACLYRHWVPSQLRTRDDVTYLDDVTLGDHVDGNGNDAVHIRHKAPGPSAMDITQSRSDVTGNAHIDVARSSSHVTPKITRELWHLAATCQTDLLLQPNRTAALHAMSRTLLYFRAQLVAYMFAPNDELLEYLSTRLAQSKIPARRTQEGAVIGIHVRRGDKIRGLYKEMPAYPFEAYVALADQFRRSANVPRPTVYVTSDDMVYVRKEAKKFAAKWNFIFAEGNSTGYSAVSSNKDTFRSLVDLWLLSECTHVVAGGASFYARTAVLLGIAKHINRGYRFVEGTNMLMSDKAITFIDHKNYYPL